jgi:hypothetical protein
MEQIIADYWDDKVKAWELGEGATYTKRPSQGVAVDAQETFLRRAIEGKKPSVHSRPRRLRTKATVRSQKST